MRPTKRTTAVEPVGAETVMPTGIFFPAASASASATVFAAET